MESLFHNRIIKDLENQASQQLVINSISKFCRPKYEEKLIEPLPILKGNIKRDCQYMNAPLYTISNIEDTSKHLTVSELNNSKISTIFPQKNEENSIIENICLLYERLDWDPEILISSIKVKKEDSKSKNQLSKLLISPKIDDGRFYYCLPRSYSHRKLKYDPYNLKVVSSEEAKEYKIFWTISASSVTTVIQNTTKPLENDIAKILLSDCNVIPLVQWVREKYLFHKLCKMKTFICYRYWKAFTMWRQNIKSCKVEKSRNHLAINLPRTEPIFQICINKIQSLTENILEKISVTKKSDKNNFALFCIDTFNTYSLMEFKAVQDEQVRSFKMNIKEIEKHILEEVLKTCQQYSEKIGLQNYLDKIQKGYDQEEKNDQFNHTERVRIRRCMHFIRDFLKLLDCQFIQLCYRILKKNIFEFNQQIMDSISNDNILETEFKESKYKPKSIFQVDLNLSISSLSESTEFNDDSKKDSISAIFTTSENLNSFVKLQLDVQPELVKSVSQETEVYNFSSPESTVQDEEDLKDEEDKVMINASKIPDRFAIDESLLVKLILHKNEKISTRLSLDPIVESIVDCLKNAIQEAESAIYSLETLSSQQCLDMYLESRYDNTKPFDDTNQMFAKHSPKTVSENIKLVLDNDKEYCGLIKNILHKSIESLGNLCSYLPEFDFCCEYVEEALKEHARISAPGFRWEIEEYQNLLASHTEQILEINNIVAQKRIGFTTLILTNLVHQSSPYIAKILTVVNENLSNEASTRNDNFIQHLRTATKSLNLKSNSVEEFVEHLDFISKINGDLLSMDKEAKFINQLFTIIINFNISMPLEQLALYKTLNNTYQKLKNNIIYHEAKRDENIRKFSTELEKKIEEIRVRIIVIKEKTIDPSLLDQTQNQSMILEQLGSLKNEVQELSSKIRSYSIHQERFGSLLTKENSKSRLRQQFEKYDGHTASNLQEEVEEVERDLSMRYMLWATKSEWEKWYDFLLLQKLDETDIHTVRQTVNRISHTVNVLEKSLPTNEIIPILKVSVMNCKSSLPVIIALRNDNLQLRHWQKIEKLIGVLLTKNKNFTIGELVSLKINQSCKQNIIEISESANNEMTLEQMLSKVKDIYMYLEFRLVSHSNKETWIMTGIDDINIEIDESHSIISTVKGSKYVEPIRNQVEDWERKLSHTSKVIDEWTNCQKNWLYLEPIFNNIDIQRQLSKETRLFHEVDSEWRSLMQQTHEIRLVLKCCTKQGVYQTLQNCNLKLEQIQKSLEEYLETKQILFPRFFFLSNDELLDILSNAQDPGYVQRHLTKLFANVFKLQIDSSSQSQSITNIVSYEGEIFPMPRNIRVRGLVEQWLTTLEQSIFEAVKRQIKLCLIEMKQKNFIDWALSNFGQSILVSTQIEFSQNVSLALMVNSSPEVDKTYSISSIIIEILKKLETLAITISQNIVNYKRLALEAMIVTNVHNRDSVQYLKDSGITSDSDFEWLKQLRYLWDEFASQCTVVQFNSSFEYGNEYLGCSSRLVITPLTDKCYLTMTGALSFNLGGCAKGPAGTGKSETIKDLSKVIGRQCVVFNCSEKLDNSTVAKLLSGVIQVGSWCCFDEFNRMNLEVLSVIAAQLFSIKSAKDAKMERFLFENKEIKLNQYCGIFITMNPSYAGRVELPDNLNFLFRPVAMMVPDYALISEVILFSEGFITAKILSSKITNLYRLCNDQLSDQKHYDFGLRSIKSVLLLMGHLRLNKILTSKNGLLRSDEEIGILIQAINISNLGRLITEDLPIFKSIMNDLFSSNESRIENDFLLEKSIDIGYKELGYEAWPEQIEKIKQLNSQLESRHGVMLLGPSASGKTVIRLVLQKALMLLPLITSSNDTIEVDRRGSRSLSGSRAKIDVHVINPKAITINNLYGYVNAYSLDWIEGIIPFAAKKMIKICIKNQEESVEEFSSNDANVKTITKSNSNLNEENVDKRRRRSSLLSIALIKRLSIKPKLSIESEETIKEVVENQFTKENKIPTKKNSKSWQWIVLDGPIDSEWVENLNTVLDDSRILCLANGERINIPSTLKFLFEVDNLKNSSPATVSRCAMIYIGDQSLSWEPQVKCWLKNKLPKHFPESGKIYLWKLFEISIIPGIKFLGKCTKLQIVPNTRGQSQLFTLLCILEALIVYMSMTKDSADPAERNKDRTSDKTNVKENTSEFYTQKNSNELNIVLGKLFVFAFTWSFGAAFNRIEDPDIEDNITNSDKKSMLSINNVTENFNSLVKNIFENNNEFGVRLPLDNKSIYSYFIDLENGNFVNWDILVPSTKNLIDATGIISFDSKNSSNNETKKNEMIVSIDTIRYSFLAALIILNKYPLLMAGDNGIGKTTLINNIFESLSKKNGSLPTNPDSILGKVFMYKNKKQNVLTNIQNLSKFSDNENIEDDMYEKPVHTLSEVQTFVYAKTKFDSQISVAKAMQLMTSKMIKRGQDIMGPNKNKTMYLFIDDLNMPTADEFGSQATLEMVRQWVELNGFYDSNSLTWNFVTDCSLIAACSPINQSPISGRLTKHFCILTLPQPSVSALERIFQVKLGKYIYQKDFMIEIKAHLSNIVSIPISMFFKVKDHFKTSPQKSHYVFNLNILHKIINSLLMSEDKVIVNKVEAGKFVAHEIIREFHDRLICDYEKDIFYRLLSDELHMFLKLNWLGDDLKKQDIMFGSFFPLKNSSSSSKVYQQITDKQKLIRLFENILKNFDNETFNMNNFIFFNQSVQHIVRCTRILNQPSGHMLMIGIEGCGKYSNVKISAAITGCSIFRLNMTSEYNNMCFRLDIKKVIDKFILQNRPCVIYLSDVDDLVNDSFMDDLCNLMNSGTIPDLYENEELETILSVLKQEDPTIESNSEPNDCFFLLVEKIKRHLHLIIGLSPNNLQYRSKLRNYPSLINSCTIDWYMSWTHESLMNVGRHRITEIIEHCNIDLEDKQESVNQLTECFIDIFNTSIEIGEKFQSEMRRPYFLSSGDFIEYLRTFSSILQVNYNKNLTNKQRLLNGLSKLSDTKALIAKMKEDLVELTPKIKEKSEEAEKLLRKIQDDKICVLEIEEIVKNEEEIIQIETNAVEKYSKECEEDLLSVIPVLEAAIKALNSLDKASISEVRVYRSPPRLVEIVMSAVCILMSVTPNWVNAKLLLGDSNFMSRILNYNKDNINKKIYKDLCFYTKQKDFNPESVGKVSVACKSICQWVLAIEHYYTINDMVIPKTKTVSDVRKALELSKRNLEWKQSQLKKVEDHVRNLDTKYQNSLEEQKKLKERVQITNERLLRAAALIDALQSEKDRWSSGVANCDESMKNILGSCIISSAYTTFTGPWTSLYRDNACRNWTRILTEKNISLEENYKFVEYEFSAYTVLNWHNNGLPRDKSMAENVAIIEKSGKWPLLIDPQNQGKKFLQKIFKDSFKVVSCKQKDYIILLERAIQVGDIICIEDIKTSIDPVLGPLLRHEIYYKGNMPMIRLGDTELEYSPSFKLYLMSSLANPQLASSVSKLVSIVNFTVNMLGLKEQLLSLIVSKERPEIEEMRNQFLRTYASDLESLRDLEDKTLGLLQDSTEKIVNDSELAQNLEQSKITASDIIKRLEETVQAEKQLQFAREFYLPLAIRGALIYFVLSDLAVVNYMYQYSLSWFQNLFIECVDSINRELSDYSGVSEKFEEIKLQRIIDSITFNSYHLVSYGLLSIHKPLFAFMLCTTVLRYSDDGNENKITSDEWAIFIKLHTISSIYGGNIKVLDEMGQELKQPDKIEWLTSETWKKCKYLESELSSVFSGLSASLTVNSESWTQWNSSGNPFNMAEYNFGRFPIQPLTWFNKIIVISILCSYKLIDCAREFVKLVLGERFASFTESNLLKLFSETPAKIPIVLILGTNSDPVNKIMKLVTELRGNSFNLDIISMGRGQASKAESLIQKTYIHKGRWIFLQNCDLMISWMQSLQKIIENLRRIKQDNDPNFKLIISTHPHADFPISILQNSMKVAIESPNGIKNQMLKSFAQDGTGNVTEEIFNLQTQQIRKMIFNLCLFNAVVLERRNYGSLGFSTPYDFNESDLDISIKQLPSFMTCEGSVQWNALYNIIGNINYGGKITDNLDRRCLINLLQNYESDNDSESGIGLLVKQPEDPKTYLESFNSINTFIRLCEFSAGKTEVLLGLGDNAEIVRLENQSKSFIIDIIVQQSKHHEDKKTLDNHSSLEMLQIMSDKIPKSIEEYIFKRYGNEFLKDYEPAFSVFYKLEEAMQDDLSRFNKYVNKEELKTKVVIRFFDSPFHNVLEQEIRQYNQLLNRIHKDIKMMIGYLLGNKNITENLESVLDYISINLVPTSWGLLSIGKSLSEWSFNVETRIDFIAFWCYNLLLEYHKFLNMINVTEGMILTDKGSDAVRLISTELEALLMIHEQKLMEKVNKNIACYWLPGFFSPQSFMTAVMQNEARKLHTSVDMLSLSTSVLSTDALGELKEFFTQAELYDLSKSISVTEIITNATCKFNSGILVFGLYLDNGMWNVCDGKLDVNSSQKRYCKLPMVHLVPIVEANNNQFDQKENLDIYQCPLYRTSNRFGILSSSGKSSNFLCFLDLKSNKSPSYWILRGTAALLQCEIE